jgi:predicted ester cyclase
VNARSFRFLAVVSLIAALSAGCQSQTSTTGNAPVADAQGEANKALVRSFVDEMTSGDTTKVDSLVAESFVEHQEMPGMAPGREGVKAMIAGFHVSFPDLKNTINDIGVDGDKVWMYSNMSGTMKGEFMGMKATGKSFNVEAFDLVRIENGKAVEHWGVLDAAAMMAQLAGTPPSAGAAKGAKAKK